MSSKKSHNSGFKTKTVIAVTLFVFGLSVIAGIYFEQNTRITDVSFNGNTFTSDEELFNAIDSPVGMLADSVSLPELYRSLNRLPYVKSTTAGMASRGKLTFSVREREPLAMIINSGNSVFVDKDGVALPVITGKKVDVPLLYGFPVLSAADTIKSESFGRVSNFLAAAKEKPFSWLTISEITWSEHEGVVALSSENGVKLIFGSNDFERKLDYWEAFYSQVASHEGIRAYRSIDLRFRNQIVADKI